MNPNQPVSKIWCCAGEVSGDRILSQVLEKLQHEISVDVRGIYGSYTSACLKRKVSSPVSPDNSFDVDFERLSVNGILDVIIGLPYFLHLLWKVKRDIKRFKPHLVLLVDFPGFNQLIMKHCKKNSVPTYYIAPPQAFAYHHKNLSHFKNQRVQLIFEMDRQYYENVGAKVTMGHFFDFPAAENVQFHTKTSENKNLCICPGSRLPVLKRNLPLMLKAISQCDVLKERIDECFILVPSHLKAVAEGILAKSALHSHRVTIKTNLKDILPYVHVAISFPGTINLKLAIHHVPTLIFCALDPITYFVGKRKLKTLYLSLPNILAHKHHFKALFPELIVNRGIQTGEIEKNLLNLLENPVDWPNWRACLSVGKGSDVAVKECAQILGNSTFLVKN